MNDGTVATPAYSFLSETTTGIWRSAAGTTAIAAGGANLATFAAATISLLSPNTRLGIANSVTGVLEFANAANVNIIEFQAGATAANTTYTWPLDYPLVGGNVLASTVGVLMSWVAGTGLGYWDQTGTV